MTFEKISNVTFGGIEWDDYPDLCDMYVEEADYDGVPMTQDQLDQVNEDSIIVYELFQKFYF